MQVALGSDPALQVVGRRVAAQAWPSQASAVPAVAVEASSACLHSTGCSAGLIVAGLAALRGPVRVQPALGHKGRRLPRAVQRRSGIEEFNVFQTSDGETYELHADQVLGAGAQGTVYRGKNAGTGKEVAIKAIPTWKLALDGEGDAKMQAIETELATLRTVGQHPNIAGLIAEADAFRRGSKSKFPHYKLLVMELVEGAELGEHVVMGGAMKESVARHVFLQVLDALDHMHRRGVIHRDLKPENVLVAGTEMDFDSKVYLIDFGVAKCVSHGPLKTVVGTPSIMAPEVARARLQDPASRLASSPAPSFTFPGPATHSDSVAAHASFSWQQTSSAGAAASSAIIERDFCPKIDVWSAGIILYTCLTGKLPFKDEREIINSDYQLEPLQHCSDEAKDLLASMLAKDADDRFTLDECLRHSWIACSESDACTIDWESMNM